MLNARTLSMSERLRTIERPRLERVFLVLRTALHAKSDHLFPVTTPRQAETLRGFGPCPRRSFLAQVSRFEPWSGAERGSNMHLTRHATKKLLSRRARNSGARDAVYLDQDRFVKSLYRLRTRSGHTWTMPAPATGPARRSNARCGRVLARGNYVLWESQGVGGLVDRNAFI